MELSDIIEMVDIVEYISQFVELEERHGEYWGLSPFKDEDTPSFSVRKEINKFYDFSSGIGGNVYTFIKHYNKCSSKQAVNILKRYVGIEDNGDNTDIVIHSKLPATLSCKKFKVPEKYKGISGGKQKIFSEEYLNRFEKDEDKLKHWENEGISKESLDRFQVLYDRFSDRLVYPIRNLNGEIVNIGGRTLDKDWKAKGLRKYTYFSGWGESKEMNIIYGLYDNMKYILEEKEVIIFEGCKSVLISDTWGIRNTAAILTSHLNPIQMKILAKLGVRVVFALDKDVDILKDHNINKLKSYVAIDYIKNNSNVFGSKDSPVDKGLAEFAALYESRIRYR